MFSLSLPLSPLTTTKVFFGWFLGTRENTRYSHTHIHAHTHMHSVTVLGILCFIIFHLAVTLPLAILVSEQLVTPWLNRSKVLPTKDLPDWAVLTVTFAVMSVAFSLRAHVIAANAASEAN